MQNFINYLNFSLKWKKFNLNIYCLYQTIESIKSKFSSINFVKSIFSKLFTFMYILGKQTPSLLIVN